MNTLSSYYRQHLSPVSTLLLLVLLSAIIGVARADRPDTPSAPAHTPLPLLSPVQDKNFYLLSLLERDPAVKKTTAGSEVLKRLRDGKLDVLRTTFANSEKGDAQSITDLSFSDAEISEAGAELSRLYRSSADVRRLTDGPLRSCGLYLKYRQEPGPAFLADAWRDCALGVNNIVAVYGLGKSGRSPSIDSISYDAKSLLYGALVHNILGALLDDKAAQELFFQPGLKFALALLDANRRDEAGRFEPMEKGENRAAFRRISSIRWEKYPYSVIVIPGYGPEETGVSLSSIGKLEVMLAARRFREGKAPILLVSGGYVHPKQTPYCEAFQMKRSLMKDFGVPENAILIDPHARHTTTNLRNAARLIYRYGIPFDKPGLITTNTYQSADIESKAFFMRCQRVFGYQPHQVLKRLSPFDLEFLPKIECLYADPIDPLDP